MYNLYKYKLRPFLKKISGNFKKNSHTGSYRFSRRITSQLQNWTFVTYLHGEPRNIDIYSMQECQNVSNTSRHQKVVVSLLNLPCYSHFSCLENFKYSFWKIMIFAVVTLFFWKSDMHPFHSIKAHTILMESALIILGHPLRGSSAVSVNDHSGTHNIISTMS